MKLWKTFNARSAVAQQRATNATCAALKQTFMIRHTLAVATTACPNAPVVAKLKVSVFARVKAAKAGNSFNKEPRISYLLR